MRSSTRKDPIFKYRSAVAALQCIAPLDPTLRGRRLLARGLARALLPADLGPLRYAFEELLGEPAASAHRLLYDWFFYRQLEARSWIDSRADDAGGLLMDAQRIGEYLTSCRHGVVVATIHLGNYLEGLRQLRLATSLRRPVFVVRRTQWSDVEARAFARIASGDLALTVLRAGRRAAAIAIRELRRGSVVVVLYDLPLRFGGTVDVDFFARRASFVRGPAEIAMLGEADILPIFTHYDHTTGVSVVEAMPALAARSVPHEQRAHRVSEIAQRLVTLAEQQIRRHPSQWAHWLLIHELVLKSAGHRGDVGVISAQ